MFEYELRILLSDEMPVDGFKSAPLLILLMGYACIICSGHVHFSLSEIKPG